MFWVITIFYFYLKAHKVARQGFFSFIIFSQLRRPIEPKFSQVCYLMHMLRYTNWEDWSLTILPKVSSTFENNMLLKFLINIWFMGWDYDVNIWECGMQVYIHSLPHTELHLLADCKNNCHLFKVLNSLFRHRVPRTFPSIDDRNTVAVLWSECQKFRPACKYFVSRKMRHVQDTSFAFLNLLDQSLYRQVNFKVFTISICC